MFALSSSALSIDLGGYTGPVKFKLTSGDMGTIYLDQPTSPVIGIDAVNSLDSILYNSATGIYYDTLGNASNSADYNEALREDGWGIFRITGIYIDDSNSALYGEALWVDGQGGAELTGIFYGLIDNAVAFDPNTGDYTIQSQNVMYDIYLNEKGTFVGAGGFQQGSAGRTGFDEYNGITGGTLMLSGRSVYGEAAEPYTNEFVSAEDAEFMSYFKPNNLGSGSGTYATRIFLTGGEWYENFVTDDYFDMTLQGTTTVNGGGPTIPSVGDWTVLDEDPLRGTYKVIPEPITMVALGLGLAGLGGYVRRRLS